MADRIAKIVKTFYFYEFELTKDFSYAIIFTLPDWMLCLKYLPFIRRLSVYISRRSEGGFDHITDHNKINFQFSIFNFQFTNSRRSEGGIAPVSGTGDRGFESRRFDQKDRF